ncbi:MAG: MFS transporter [Candidatus Diapherotrites archaeon CG08_land_8_20_14_0_20_30_16]|nr:MAG: MFS transporter [Candidatus Diapherotrites archaeon CG08_land_8_20_14_0_20_30_16]
MVVDSKKKPRNVWLLGITSFFNDIGGEMLMPILPLFLVYLGAPGIVIGIIAGLREAIGKSLQIFAGFWSDRIGKRKPFVIFGYFFSGFSKICLALSTIWPIAIIFSCTERIGKGVREAPRDAIIVESGMAHGKAFAIQKSLDTAGGIFGSILVFVLYDVAKLSYVSIILIASCFAFFSLVPVVFVKDLKTKPEKQNMIQQMRKLPKSVWLFIIVSTFFAFANFGYMFLILRAQQNFSGVWAVGGPLLLYVLFNLIYAGFSIPFGIWADKVGRRRLMMGGYFLFILMSVILAIFNNLTMLIIAFILFGLVYAILQSQQKAEVADLSPAELNGIAIGAWNTVTGLVALPAGFVAGFLWDLNPSYTFVFGAIVCFAGFVVFYFARKKHWF